MNTELNYTPDFSGDDFANDKQIQQSRKAAALAQKLYDNSIAIIRKELNLAEGSHKNFKTFSMFKGLEATLLDSFCNEHGSRKMIVSVAEYHSSYPIPRNSNEGTDLYLFGYLELSKSFPATYIHKETVRERISDLFLKLDTDFRDQKKFSRKFRVLTKDKDGLMERLRFIELDQLAKFPNMEAEIKDHAILFRHSREAMSPDEATRFVELAKVLINLFK
jgi:hypothetical protein